MSGWVPSEPGERPVRPIEDVGIEIVGADRHEVTAPPAEETPQPATYDAPVVSPPQPTAEPEWVPYNSEELLGSLPAPREAQAQQGVRRALGLAPSEAERAERRARELAATPYPRPVTIVVANPKGGAGKTPITLLLAGALGTARGGGVVAWDNNELRGNLHLRTTDLGNRNTVIDLLRAMPHLTLPDVRVGDVASYLRPQLSGQYDALVSSTNTYTQIEAEHFAQVHRLLYRFYRVVVIDTGNNEASSNWREAMKTADVLVVPIKWKASASNAAVQMFEDLQRQGPAARDLVQRTVIAASNGPGDINKDVEAKLRPYFTARAAAVVDIPTDTHIAEEGRLDHAALQPATRRAALELAAKVAEQISRAMKGPNA